MMKIIALSLLALFVLFFVANETPAQDKKVYVCAADLVSTEKPKREGVRSAVSQPSKKWIPGQKIRVRFLNGSQFLQAKVRQYAEVWERFGNIDFVFVPSGTAEIRVSFGWGAGSWSFIGKDSLTNSYVKSANGTRFVNDDSGTSMNFGWFDENTSDEEFRHITLHEFGHALGLHHEHQNRNGNIQWNKEAVIAYFAELGWPKERTQSQVLDKYGADSDVTNGVYDRLSIMHYSYPAELIRGGVGIPRNTVLSDGDKRIIAEMYPFNQSVSVKDPDEPQPPVVDRNQPSISFSNIDVDFDGYREDTEEHGMEFSSYFNVTNGLKQDFSIVIYFYNADGKPMLDTNKKYAVGGQVATYRYFRPDYPTAVYKDLRLFIPYEELEGIQCGDNHLKYTIGIWKGNKRVTSVGATYFTLTVDCED